MTIGVPDLLSSLRLQRSNDSLSRLIETASREMATGVKSDTVAASGGDLRRLYAIDSRLDRLTTTADTLSLAGSRAAITQDSLTAISGLSGKIGTDMLAAAERHDVVAARLAAESARGAFASVVNTLNGRFAGRSLFAGAATDVAALQSADEMLTDLQALVDANYPDTDAALTAIDDYFNDAAGGFTTTAYTGATQDAPAADLGDGTMSDYAVRADADELRAVLKGLATAVMAVESSFTDSDVSVLLMLRTAGTDAISARAGITQLQAELGVEEERIEDAATATTAQSTSLKLARNRMIAADPFESASNFQALEAQLQSVYTITARLSGLTLTDYLR